jgi:hypothetical protein
MRKTLAAIAGFGLLAALAAHAKGDLKLTCTTRDLPPGTHVWVEVEARYQQQVAGGPAEGGFRDASPTREVSAKHTWQFEVPASGEVTPQAFDYPLPMGANRAKADSFGSIYLRTRFKVDDPRGSKRGGYGQETEVTFGMPSPAGATELARCLRFRDEGKRLKVETAADCQDASFEKARLGANRVHMKPSSR